MNKMIVNPDKVQAIIFNKKRSDLTNRNFQVGNQVIKSVSSVELFGIKEMASLILIYTLGKIVNLRQID